VRSSYNSGAFRLISKKIDYLTVICIRDIWGGEADDAMYEPEQLRTFLAVAESLSFTQAAARWRSASPR
jgi:hypothetical protein